MKSKWIKIVIIFVLAAGFLYAKSPVRYMNSRAIGIECQSIWRGQTITEAEVASHEQFWHLAANYSPFEYLQFNFGIGAERFRVDTHDSRTFKGNYGLSFSGGAHANTPAFLKQILRITAGCDLVYINSEDDYSYKYSGPTLNPNAGLVIYAGPFVEIEAGSKGHIILGKMTELKKNETHDFSNNETIRGYLNFCVCSPSGAYAKFHFDASPLIQEDWKNGPYEAGIGFSVGYIIKDDKKPKKRSDKDKKEKKEYFPEYDKMKDKIEEMEDKLE